MFRHYAASLSRPIRASTSLRRKRTLPLIFNTGIGGLVIAPVRVRAEVISYTCRLDIFNSAATSTIVRISITRPPQAARTFSPRLPVPSPRRFLRERSGGRLHVLYSLRSRQSSALIFL